MTPIDKDLDDAAERLKDGAPKPTAKPKRANSPEYVVFKLEMAHAAPLPAGDEVEAWVPVLGRNPNGDLVVTRASSRKAAVEVAMAEMEEKAGTFAVVPAKEFQPIKRKVRTEEISEFE